MHGQCTHKSTYHGVGGQCSLTLSTVPFSTRPSTQYGSEHKVHAQSLLTKC